MAGQLGDSCAQTVEGRILDAGGTQVDIKIVALHTVCHKIASKMM